MYIDSVRECGKSSKSVGEQHAKCKWKFSFELHTIYRKYLLFARTAEEQFLWLTAFYEIAQVEVIDMGYQPNLLIQ